MPVVLPSLLVFVATAVLVFAVLNTTNRRKWEMQQRVRAVMSSTESMLGRDPSVEALTAAQAATAAALSGQRRPDLLPSLSDILDRRDTGKELRTAMMRAGLPLRPSEYLALMLICVALFGLVGAVLTRQFAMTILMGLVGFLIPVAWVSSRQAERKRKFEEQLPDALTLIVSSLRSGFSFLRAMQEVSDELPPPMAEEFAWALQEANLGVATGLVLERMAARIRSYDLGLIVTAICIHLEVGGNLAELLETINETIRERVRVQGEIQSLTAEGKLSGVVLILVPIVIGIMINLRDPDYLKPLFTTPIGLCLLAGAVVGQVVGAMIIKKQVALDV